MTPNISQVPRRANFSKPRAETESGLDPHRQSVCIRVMKLTIFAGLLGGLLIISSGCVDTVGGGTAGGVPFIKDRVEGRYERPLNQVFDAAMEVVKFNGTLVKEST